MDSILRITDGTTTVNLYSLTGGIKAQSVRAPFAQPKGGGAWSESALEDGRQLVDFQWTNIVETFTVDLVGGTPNAAWALLRQLYSLLVQAAQYWRDPWRSSPVWMERQGCQSNMEYAVVYHGVIPGAPEIFDEPFLGNAALAGLELTIEHTDWREHPPDGSSTAYALAAYQSYGGKVYGNVNSAGTVVPTTAQEVYCANLFKTSQITDIYRYDASGPSWSGNLQGAAPPYDLYPAVPAVGDFCIFGVNTAVAATSGPFWSLVFDIAPATIFTGGEITWEVYTSGGWIPVYIIDTTSVTKWGSIGELDSFNVGGVGSAHWHPTTTQTTGNLATLFPGPPAGPNITGYWVRARITDLPAGGPPEQQNRDIYTVNIPFVEVLSDQVSGDGRARAKLTVVGSSGWNRMDSNDPVIGRYIMGLRSYDRGSNFCAFLPASNEQMPTGVTCVAHVGAFTTDVTAPTGISLQWTPGATGIVDVFSHVIVSPTADDYLGTFHAFLRALKSGGSSTDNLFRLQVIVGNHGIVFAETDWEPFELAATEIADWHTVMVPGRLPADNVERIILKVQANVIATGATFKFFDTILIPVDEWAADVLSPNHEVNCGNAIHLEIDSITHAKQYIIANAIDTLTIPDGLSARYRVVSNGPAQFTPGTRQRLWVLQLMTNDIDEDTHEEYPDIILVSTVSAIGQGSYWTPRGGS